MDRKNSQAIIKVAAELPLGNALDQIAVCGRNQADIHSDCLVAAQSLELLVLQHAQQFRLQFERDVAHFIQKQRPPVGQFQPADLLVDRASECPLLVPEQL